MEASTAVPTSAQKAGKPAAKAPLRTAAKPRGPKKVRPNGMVKATILFDPQTDSLLTALAFAWQRDRSDLARQIINERVTRYNIAEELAAAAQRYSAAGVSQANPGASGQSPGSAIPAPKSSEATATAA
jgi:hypothetical protein